VRHAHGANKGRFLRKPCAVCSPHTTARCYIPPRSSNNSSRDGKRPWQGFLIAVRDTQTKEAMAIRENIRLAKEAARRLGCKYVAAELEVAMHLFKSEPTGQVKDLAMQVLDRLGGFNVWLEDEAAAVSVIEHKQIGSKTVSFEVMNGPAKPVDTSIPLDEVPPPRIITLGSDPDMKIGTHIRSFDEEFIDFGGYGYSDLTPQYKHMFRDGVIVKFDSPFYLIQWDGHGETKRYLLKEIKKALNQMKRMSLGMAVIKKEISKKKTDKKEYTVRVKCSGMRIGEWVPPTPEEQEVRRQIILRQEAQLR